MSSFIALCLLLHLQTWTLADFTKKVITLKLIHAPFIQTVKIFNSQARCFQFEAYFILSLSHVTMLPLSNVTVFLSRFLG